VKQVETFALLNKGLEKPAFNIKTPQSTRDERGSRGTTLFPADQQALCQVRPHQMVIPAPEITVGGTGSPTGKGLVRVQFAAPEGFSVPVSAPAHTNPGFAVRTARTYSFPSSLV